MEPLCWVQVEIILLHNNEMKKKSGNNNVLCLSLPDLRLLLTAENESTKRNMNLTTTTTTTTQMAKYNLVKMYDSSVELKVNIVQYLVKISFHYFY